MDLCYSRSEKKNLVVFKTDDRRFWSNNAYAQTRLKPRFHNMLYGVFPHDAATLHNLIVKGLKRKWLMQLLSFGLE